MPATGRWTGCLTSLRIWSGRCSGRSPPCSITRSTCCSSTPPPPTSRPTTPTTRPSVTPAVDRSPTNPAGPRPTQRHRGRHRGRHDRTGHWGRGGRRGGVSDLWEVEGLPRRPAAGRDRDGGHEGRAGPPEVRETVDGWQGSTWASFASAQPFLRGAQVPHVLQTVHDVERLLLRGHHFNGIAAVLRRALQLAEPTAHRGQAVSSHPVGRHAVADGAVGGPLGKPTP